LKLNDDLKPHFFSKYLPKQKHRLNGATDIENLHKTNIGRLRDVMDGIEEGKIKFEIVKDDDRLDEERSKRKRQKQ